MSYPRNIIPTPWWIWILFWMLPIILFKIWMYRKKKNTQKIRRANNQQWLRGGEAK